MATQQKHKAVAPKRKPTPCEVGLEAALPMSSISGRTATEQTPSDQAAVVELIEPKVKAHKFAPEGRSVSAIAKI